MPIQPQLVLLQKTLINIEGLGRQLYPELDLWETAHPYLEKWLKRRFHPKTMYKDLKRQAPEWMERLPELPHMVLQSAAQAEKISEALPSFVKLAKTLDQQNQRQSSRKRIKLIALILLALAGLAMKPSISDLPMEAWVFAGLGILALLMF